MPLLIPSLTLSRKFWWKAAIALVGLTLLLVFAVDLRQSPSPSALELREHFSVSGALKAGAARIALNFDEPVPIAGYPSRKERKEVGEHPLFARALALEVQGKVVVLVSAELLLVPRELRERVLRKLSPSLDSFLPPRDFSLILSATHTHSGPGGYWDLALAQRMGVGAFEEAIAERLAEGIAQAVREALASFEPARLAVGQIEASNFSLNRNGFPEVDKRLSVIRVDALDDSPLAQVVLYAAHPTLSPRDTPHLSGDWPGAMMRSLEAGDLAGLAGGAGSEAVGSEVLGSEVAGSEVAGPGVAGSDEFSDSSKPVALFLQGALGDVTWGKRAGEMSRERRMERFGQAVASDARGALAVAGRGEAELSLRYSRVRFPLPPADAKGLVPGILVRGTSNLLHFLLKREFSELSLLSVNDTSFAFVPGEPVAQLGLVWRGLLGGANLVALADDYVGYVELPARIEAREGEAKRSYFGTALAPALLDALQRARAPSSFDAVAPLDAVDPRDPVEPLDPVAPFDPVAPLNSPDSLAPREPLGAP